MRVLYFSTLAWDEAGGAHNPTQLSRALARRGDRVLFVEPQPGSRPRAADPATEVVALTELGFTPSQLRRAWYGLESGDLSRVAENLAARLGPPGPGIAVFAAPFEPYVRLVPWLQARGGRVVYYAMDDFQAAPALGYTQFDARAEQTLTREADLRVSVTPHVAQTLARFGAPAHVIPNGWSGVWPRSPGPPVTLARGELTLGYWGTLMESLFDADLVAHVSTARPAWAIHLLGATDPEPHRPSVAARLGGLPNVYFHGAVAHADLPRYAVAFDVALAPFPDNAFTRGRDPLKVYEYLAAHLPVAASYAPQLSGRPHVYVGMTPGEFVDAIETAERMPVDALALDAYLAAQTWDARAAALVALLETTPFPPRSPAAAGGILPDLARPDPAARLRYARALEAELAQVQAWARQMEADAHARAKRPGARLAQLVTRGRASAKEN